MNNSNPSSEERLRSELEKLGAQGHQVVALCMDVARGQAALDYAIAKGADRPIPYAIAVFDNPDWHPSGEKARVATNVAVDVKCEACGGDRFVLVGDYDLKVPYSETYAPCKRCNPSADTAFWRPYDGSRAHTAAR